MSASGRTASQLVMTAATTEQLTPVTSPHNHSVGARVQEPVPGKCREDTCDQTNGEGEAGLGGPSVARGCPDDGETEKTPINKREPDKMPHNPNVGARVQRAAPDLRQEDRSDYANGQSEVTFDGPGAAQGCPDGKERTMTPVNKHDGHGTGESGEASSSAALPSLAGGPATTVPGSSPAHCARDELPVLSSRLGYYAGELGYLHVPMRGGGLNDPSEVADGPRSEAPPAGSPVTLILGNLPVRCTPAEVLIMVAESGFSGNFDLFYMPGRVAGGRNRGCAFVKFADMEGAIEFAGAVNGRRVAGRTSAKELAVWVSPLQLEVERLAFAHIKVKLSSWGPVIELKQQVPAMSAALRGTGAGAAGQQSTGGPNASGAAFGLTPTPGQSSCSSTAPGEASLPVAWGGWPASVLMRFSV